MKKKHTLSKEMKALVKRRAAEGSPVSLEDCPPEKVLFRMWGKSVIALFPYIPSDPYGNFCESYEHIGEHGGADYQSVMRKSRPATPKEYADLKVALERRGYDLEIIHRATNHYQYRQEVLSNTGITWGKAKA